MIAAISYRQIRRKLESSEASLLSPPLRRLARAVWNIRTSRRAHVRYCAALVALVDAEMDGKLAMFDGAIREHIQGCNRCASLYTELLEISLLESSGRLPRPSLVPAPDLSFLETPYD